VGQGSGAHWSRRACAAIPPHVGCCPAPPAAALFPEVAVWILEKKPLIEQASRSGHARAFDLFFEQQRRGCSQLLGVGMPSQPWTGHRPPPPPPSWLGRPCLGAHGSAAAQGWCWTPHHPALPAAHPRLQLKHPGVIKILEPVEETASQVRHPPSHRPLQQHVGARRCRPHHCACVAAAVGGGAGACSAQGAGVTRAAPPQRPAPPAPPPPRRW